MGERKGEKSGRDICNRGSGGGVGDYVRVCEYQSSIPLLYCRADGLGPGKL